MSALVDFCSSPKRTSQTITLLIKALMILLLPMTLSTCPQTACFIWICLENKPTFHWDASFKQVKIESGWVITVTQLVWKYFRLTFPTVCRLYNLLIKKQTPSMFGTTSSKPTLCSSTSAMTRLRSNAHIKSERQKWILSSYPLASQAFYI